MTIKYFNSYNVVAVKDAHVSKLKTPHVTSATEGQLRDFSPATALSYFLGEPLPALDDRRFKSRENRFYAGFRRTIRTE